MLVKPQDKRRFPRLPLRTVLRYQIRGTPEFNTVVSDDISEGGLSFMNDGFIAPNRLMNLEVNILSRMISSMARTKWTNCLAHSNRCQVGVEFLEMSQNERNYLNDYINMHLGQD